MQKAQRKIISCLKGTHCKDLLQGYCDYWHPNWQIKLAIQFEQAAKVKRSIKPSSRELQKSSQQKKKSLRNNHKSIGNRTAKNSILLEALSKNSSQSKTKKKIYTESNFLDCIFDIPRVPKHFQVQKEAKISRLTHYLKTPQKDLRETRHETDKRERNHEAKNGRIEKIGDLSVEKLFFEKDQSPEKLVRGKRMTTKFSEDVEVGPIIREKLSANWKSRNKVGNREEIEEVIECQKSSFLKKVKDSLCKESEEQISEISEVKLPQYSSRLNYEFVSDEESIYLDYSAPEEILDIRRLSEYSQNNLDPLQSSLDTPNIRTIPQLFPNDSEISEILNSDTEQPSLSSRTNSQIMAPELMSIPEPASQNILFGEPLQRLIRAAQSPHTSFRDIFLSARNNQNGMFVYDNEDESSDTSEQAALEWVKENQIDEFGGEKTFNWFISKNRKFVLGELPEKLLAREDQCIICLNSFLPSKLPSPKAFQRRFNNVNAKWPQRSNARGNLQKKQEEMILLLFCKHVFHQECILNWLTMNPACPICRTDFRDHKEYGVRHLSRKQLIKMAQNANI